MENQKNRTNRILALLAVLVIILTFLVGTTWMGDIASRDTRGAARSISLLFLDELAGRREQVVANYIRDNIDVIHIAMGMLDEEDLQDLEHLRMYQRNVKALFHLERFAFVDEGGLIYTADDGIVDEISMYSIPYETISSPQVSILNPNGADKKVVIAVPIRDRNIRLDGKQLVVCFMEIDRNVMLESVSIATQNSDASFCNIYTRDGFPLSNTVLSGIASESNLFDALARSEFMGGYSLKKTLDAFREGQRGVASFNYKNESITLSYIPIDGTDWILSYMVRDSVTSSRIMPVTDGIVMRSILQSVITATVLLGLFGIILFQTRRSQHMAMEREAAEAASRVKQEELEQRLALQDKLIRQQKQAEQQAKMITALASNYRSLYYIELDRDVGTCYQTNECMDDGYQVGDSFPYLEAMTNYAHKFVAESYREEFLRYIQPASIRAELVDERVTSFRYLVIRNGRKSYEMIRFAGVRHPEDRDDHIVHAVSVCFADVDAETRKTMSQSQALKDALSAAEQASKAKTSFLSNMSHEIRTPINAIIGLNSIALHDVKEPKIRGYLEKISVSAQHLLSLINDILDVSRIESGRMVLKNEEFSFSKGLEQVNTIISGQCRDKGLHYECRINGTVDTYYVGDGMKLRQIMLNILGNAVKFTLEGGSVTFTIEEGQRFEGKATLRFIISDTGIGMSKEFLPHIFDAFSQEDSSTTSRYGSTGLGMAITKSMVELMNGSISVESEKGKGTTFTVTVTLGESSRSSAETEGEELNPHEMSVLVIDDDPIALEHAQVVLGQIGFHCEVASSGAEGLEKARIRHLRGDNYNLILVDWKMPDMDGVETTRQIRTEAGIEMPIIILTSFNWDDIMEEAMAAGVDSFVSKPLFADNVLEEFRDAFRRRKEELADVRADLKGRRILLAEDVEVNAEIVVMVLEMREVTVEVAENGRIAVDMFANHPAGYYDAVLMDMRMPEMDGLEATRTIRAMDRPDAKAIPIIALTANAFDEDVQRSLQAGLNAHLSKPLDPDVLYETLEKLIKP